MLDIKYIKENPAEVIARLAKKGKEATAEINEILALDAERRALISSTEAIKAEQNKTNKLIPQYKKEGKDVSEIFARMKEMSATTKANDEKLKQVEGELQDLMLGLPNLPDRDLKPGAHYNSHGFLVDDFVRAVVDEKLPPNNAWDSARYMLPGVMAHESALRDGMLMDIPDFGDAPADWDRLTFERRYDD